MTWPRHVPQGARQRRVWGRMAAVASSAASVSTSSQVAPHKVADSKVCDGRRSTSIATPWRGHSPRSSSTPRTS
jgi:hypothetical protein